jgi:hypothetical protein
MSAWRTIFTDTESETGVAPVCEQPEYHDGGSDDSGVYDCCPHPHIETYSEAGAKRLSALLTELDAGPCL